jgi:hypothetical protein
VNVAGQLIGGRRPCFLQARASFAAWLTRHRLSWYPSALRGGTRVRAVFGTESQAAAFIRARVAKGTVLHADEAGSWDNLHERFEVKRIDHQEAYSQDGACTNWAEEFFSRLRRAEVGIHHHIAGAYLLRYAQESSWREDSRRVSNGDQVSRVAALAMKRVKSVDFTGYWQRHVAN